MSIVNIETEDGQVLVAVTTGNASINNLSNNIDVSNDSVDIDVGTTPINVTVSTISDIVVKHDTTPTETVVGSTVNEVTVEMSSSGSGVGDAPIDGTLYGRQDGSWQEAGDMKSLIYDPLGEDDDTFQLENMRGNLDGGTF